MTNNNINKHYCKTFEVVKDEGFAKILVCDCGREYRKFWNEDLTQMHILNEDYINDLESKKRYEKHMKNLPDVDLYDPVDSTDLYEY